ncbi:hypothetical protein OIU84_001156 [Salix udensis]|uniref:Uncharacterized protein n=1 Tax=Salix udensis TaxID=889485 RepID=A0AAD6K7U1_9ROSI|nr:hypothetical protein OIU84_001156 [Salix udensis]
MWGCVLDDCEFKFLLLWLTMLQGIYSQYESYEDDDNIASFYPGSYESTNQGQHSGQAAGGLWPNNEVMATHLQEMSIYGEESGNTASKNH